jgi:hypothetical protein
VSTSSERHGRSAVKLKVGRTGSAGFKIMHDMITALLNVVGERCAGAVLFLIVSVGRHRVWLGSNPKGLDVIARLSPGQSATTYRVPQHVSLPDAGSIRKVWSVRIPVACRWGGCLARAAILERNR